MTDVNHRRRVGFQDDNIGPSAFAETSSFQTNRSIMMKGQPLVELSSLTSEPSTSCSTDRCSTDYNSLSWQHGSRRNGLVAEHARSMFPKTKSSNSSMTSTDGVRTRHYRDLLFARSSKINDNMPLGTRSQRLFGGSEYFAEILNELEDIE
jgi:hypothetical protein